MIWSLLDPILVKFARRLEHLAVHRPSDYGAQLARSRGTFSPKAILTNEARVQNVATSDHLHVGDYSYIAGEVFLLTKDSRCLIGQHCFLGTGSRLWVQREMQIGNFVLIAPGVDVFDNDSHPLAATERREDALDLFERDRPMNYERVAASAVVIEDDVWIGTKSTIMKGVRLGRGSVVAAGSVVTRDVESFTLVGGNPAREIRKLDP